MTFVRRILQACLALGVCSCIVFGIFKLTIMQVSSDSMENTLHDGDYLLIERISTDHPNHWWDGPEPHRGQIIVFHSTINSNEVVVKRVIASEHDWVSIQDGIVILNGTKLREPYVRWQMGYNPVAYSWPIHGNRPGAGAIEVPEGSYFVLGDNRGVSFDSRQFGSVPHRDVIGVVVCSFRPY